ncbi:unnamed protein product [Rhizoctonia solani]|uniref:Transaldolase n=3 Tax=Rhizoctonia solani TaxID=456999 RepID=A0A8H2WKV9_9AGAM|nr:transaldolase [Rhizoctonia solani AG-3 Rhs1AP]KEP50901.1 transaldolase [Rhizoctonia solani 123E]CAE6394489.1 unnamed protein product [Rhizoctonia solani]CAE6479641.1 unnamed protein product [Rhizoctonia solani]
MSTSLDQLKAAGTVVVSDTGDFNSIAVYKPQDATTNPSLILAAAGKPDYAKIIDAAVAEAKSSGYKGDELVEAATDNVLVAFGTEILKIVPGRVSTEVDARLSFNKVATLAKARQLIKLYAEKLGSEETAKKRVLIKIASTWEGIQAARELEKEGIHCNLTLLFGFGQAVACAEAGVTLISPFVGRILDWYKKSTGKNYEGQEDPGVQSVTKIFNYYKQYGYKTIVMGASFRNIGEIKALAGVDYLTISPNLLEELNKSTDPVPQILKAETAAQGAPIPKVSYVDNEDEFRWALLGEPMAFDKLHEGIRKFAEDGQTLKDVLRQKLSA